MVFVNKLTLTSALGAGLKAMRETLQSDTSGLTDVAWPGSDVPGFLGKVDLPPELVIAASRESRNNRLIELALSQDGFTDAVAQYVAKFGSGRVGLVIGTSTSSIDRTEQAYRTLDERGRFEAAYAHPHTHNPHAPGDYAASQLHITGPNMTVSAACASSTKVFAAAQRWLDQDLVDAVVVGGADTLCLSIIYGFHSLQLVAPDPCRPFAPDRRGISLGEAAGFVLLSREPADIRLRGVGESCDAYHMSSAHPEGLGAKLSMQRALAAANLTMNDIDYLNLHGTGTRANDDIEGLVCSELRGRRTLFSATKGWTGHALGAAGIVEAVLAINALQTGFIPGTMHTKETEAGFDLLLSSEQREIHTVMSNSFGFGGSNCSVVFARA